MSTERDLAIARALHRWVFGLPVQARWTSEPEFDAKALAIIAEVDASLGGGDAIVAARRNQLGTAAHVDSLGGKAGTEQLAQAGSPDLERDSVEPPSDFEEGARAMFAYYTRFLNERQLCTVAFDSYLRVLTPFLSSHKYVDPSLGGLADQERAGHVQTGTEATDAEIARDGQLPGSDQSTGQPRVAEPPSDHIEAAHDEGYTHGLLVERQRAAVIIKALVGWFNGDLLMEYNQGQALLHKAAAYIAETEAQQQKEGQP